MDCEFLMKHELIRRIDDPMVTFCVAMAGTSLIFIFTLHI